MNKINKTLGDLLKDKDVLLSTNIELKLYKLAEKLGISKGDLLTGKYDKEIGDIKEDIYRLFSKRFKFKYHWDGYYKINKKDE